MYVAEVRLAQERHFKLLSLVVLVHVSITSAGCSCASQKK